MFRTPASGPLGSTPFRSRYILTAPSCPLPAARPSGVQSLGGFSWFGALAVGPRKLCKEFSEDTRILFGHPQAGIYPPRNYLVFKCFLETNG